MPLPPDTVRKAGIVARVKGMGPSKYSRTVLEIALKRDWKEADAALRELSGEEE